ncbi:18S rRNA maturation protein [Orbilia oligospora]|uniref:rRNA-processing protein EFG1 n=1 Tax=Orbilia oligospora TaxID=2813651 RepID=A0A7C8JBG9_ORBOL|nr:18S rRNA maturation protein [Orbilia oligospora]KAF3091899.1 18S rRNA maturation protein [Orbilia oligospora]KAF3135331.1 18S rRNA maturation protein [Orbilia oligospora]
MSSTTIHPSRLSQIPRPKSKKPSRPKPPKPQPASTSLTRSQLRKKIRDLTRLLNPPSSATATTKLPATTRIDHERALSAYKHELSLQQTSSKVQLLEKRYHKVRFFERRKATRALSRLNREFNALDNNTSAGEESKKEKEGLINKIHAAEVDLNYIMHYPPLEKYISLYRSGDSKDTNQKRERIRQDIEKRMEEGTLDRGDALVEANAAEGFGGGVDGKNKKKSNSNSNNKKQGHDGNKNGKSIPDKNEDEDEDEDEGSDGGFFEL